MRCAGKNELTNSTTRQVRDAFDDVQRETGNLVMPAGVEVTAPGEYDRVTATYRAQGDVFDGGQVDTDFSVLEECVGGDASTDYTDLDTYDFSGGGASTKYYPCRVIVSSARQTGRGGDYIISRNELTVLVAGLAIVPKENMKIQFAGEDHVITSAIDVLKSRALFKCECR